MKIVHALAFASLLLPAAAHAKAPVDSLLCIEQLFNDDQAKAMAEMGSSDEARSRAAMAKVDFMMLGFTSRMCAKRNGWSDNQYYNSIGYLMAWPTMRGLQLLGSSNGFAAVERAWKNHAAEWTKKKRLDDADIDTLLAEAAKDGLTAADETAKKDARRYADVLQQVAAMREDFAADRKPRNAKK